MKTTTQLTTILALLTMTTVGAETQWRRLSSTTGAIPIPNAGDQQTCCVVFDIDQDGKDDFIIGERTQAPGVVWYRFRDGKFERHIIEAGRINPEAGGAACDVDRDGDLDLILGQDYSGNAIWWWENPCPNFDKPWTRRYIKKDQDKKYHDQTCGDFDGDGTIEFVTWNQGGNQLLFFEIPDQPKSGDVWKFSTIYTYKGAPQLEGFPSIPLDINLDGKVDIVGGGLWFEHETGHAFKVHEIDAQMRFTQCAVGQLIEGGRPEVVFSPGDANGDARWYEWKDGSWLGHTLRYVQHGHTCEIRDVDQNGHDDILIGEMGNPGAGDQAKTRIWYGDGKGVFKETIVVDGQGNHEGLFGDFDGDGDQDLLVKPYNHGTPRVDVLLNLIK